MIEKIRLENIKCFEEIEIPLKSVNVLAGMNGMGKSTIIQSLLLLRQSYLADGGKKGLYLNGDYVNLGNGQDILYEKTANEKMKIGIVENGQSYDYTFGYSAQEDLQPVEEKPEEIPETFSVLGDQFIYLSAYRIKPQDLYRITNDLNLKNREFDGTGEYAFQYLSQYGSEDLENPAIILQDKLGPSLANQVRLWMDMISPGVSPQIKVDRKLRNAEVLYEYIEGRNKTNSYKSVNVGFGITYVLPVVIALLSARANDLILLENPEAHIHPKGQRKLGELIATVSTGHVQILLETHSDHILNGIRLAVKKGKIQAEDTNLLYFYKDEEDHRHKVKRPILRSDGRIKEWPAGFLDEWDQTLMELL